MQITRHTHVPTLRLQGPTPPPTPQPPEEPSPEAGESRFWPGVGGFAVGLGAGAASGAAGLLLSGQVGRVIDATMPALSNLPSTTLPVALLTASAVTIGAVAAAGISAVVGAKIAVGAARGDEKPDMTDNLQSNAAKKASPYAQNSAELRENLQGVQTAQTFKQAAASGFRAGATLAGPAGAASGKVQTALFGAMLGCAAALPLVALTGTNWAMIPGALGGALLGQKIGEPAGHAAASLVMGGLGAAGACAYHAFNRPDQA